MNSLSYLHYYVYDDLMFNQSAKIKGAGALLGAAMIYATFGLLIRESSVMFGNNIQIAIRFLFAALVIVLFKLVIKRSLSLPRRDLLKTFALGAVFGLIVMLFTISVNETKVANSVFLLYAGSIITSLICGTVFLKEKLSPSKIIAIGVAVCGLAMYADNFLVLSVGIVAGFASGLLDGVGNFIRKSLKGVDRNLVILYSYAIGGVVALGAALFSGEQWINQVHTGSIIAMLVFVGLMIGISNLLLYGFQHFDVNVGTVILACELFFATVLGYVFLQESPTVTEIIGGVLIFSASALTVIDVRAIWPRVRQSFKLLK